MQKFEFKEIKNDKYVCPNCGGELKRSFGGRYYTCKKCHKKFKKVFKECEL